MTSEPRLLLASTSRYRAELLARLQLDFEARAPDVDEAPWPGETPADRALRLARDKAAAIAARTADALVIGSDQVAELDGEILHKPGDAQTARAQLMRSSGRTVTFSTGLCVIDSRAAPHRPYTHLDTTRVRFRTLDTDTIGRYVASEQPLDCAGSFKCEGLGVALFEHIENRDPTALIGLPLIALARLLRECGVPVP